MWIILGKGKNVSGQQMLQDDKFLFSRVLRECPNLKVAAMIRTRGPSHLRGRKGGVPEGSGEPWTWNVNAGASHDGCFYFPSPKFFQLNLSIDAVSGLKAIPRPLPSGYSCPISFFLHTHSLLTPILACYHVTTVKSLHPKPSVNSWSSLQKQYMFLIENSGHKNTESRNNWNSIN